MDNPYNYHVAVQEDDLFFGHEDMRMRLISGLSALRPNSAAILGGRRCGKSSLLNKLMRDLLHRALVPGERYLVPCVLDLQCGRPLSCADDFFLWLLEKLGETWDGLSGSLPASGAETLKAVYRAEVPRGRVEAFARAFRSLDTRGQRIRLVALVDEWEVLLRSTWGDEVRPNLRNLLTNSTITPEIALVIAGSTLTYEKVADCDSPLENVLDRYLLPPLTYDATLNLAQVPNGGRLNREAVGEIWRQTGGHPCMIQYILYEQWDALEEMTQQDVQDVAATFDEVTRHCSAWTLSLGQEGYALYCFLIEQPVPTPFFALRQKFISMPSAIFQSKLDALVYHGLVHCIGRGKKRQYQIAGHLYRDWLLSMALSFSPGDVGEQREPKSLVNFYGDIVLGLKQVGVDERQQQVHGPQTNIAGNATGPILSGEFQSSVQIPLNAGKEPK